MEIEDYYDTNQVRSESHQTTHTKATDNIHDIKDEDHDADNTYFDDSSDDKCTDSSHQSNSNTQTSWDINQVTDLDTILRIWVKSKVPADQIGHFLDLCLRNRDNYAGYHLTRMVLDCETYSNIALYMLQDLGICDEDHNPLWTKMGPGDRDRRPLQKGDDGYEESYSYDCTAAAGSTFEITHNLVYSRGLFEFLTADGICLLASLL
ncbi:hypothetical protein PENDEC_c014G04956 [Penicillium decumbens]|uniref:Uncharacterized protein n=1 Tax=Penicillium decumbens TaxID=69771 RepID=A0A1V6P9G3_PENDC|nr:hypothetical protein PENDEC_c014G04956 [Penicillium decumbens]